MKKIALVTGSTQGIGLATAQKLSEDFIVIINDNKGIDDNFIQDNFGAREVYYYKADISNSNDLESLKDYILQKFGRLDMIAAHAGIIPLPCDIDNITPENIDRTINVNLIGTFNTLKILGNLIKETSKKGAIVATTSVDGIIGEPYNAIYSATKAGIISLTKSFARYFGEDIRVNAVAPGLIDTPLTASTGEDPSATTDFSIIKRMGTAEEIANAICFLLSDEASYITGQILAVDGGFTLK
ncbi:MAG: SDR family NAD(P)-dependent oxidoreductase [Bacilli bacterium]|nr:SDR family NAD(P)-dependent oxidoreductase [Bacilli bacterium]